jgi:putative redox protein
MEAKVVWSKNLSFTGTADSGFELPLGARASAGGDEDGFRPMELFAIGLAGCTAMDVISILQKKRQEVTDFEVQVHVDREESHPKVFTQGVIRYLVTGHNVDETAVKRSIELSITRYCPGYAMLSKVMPISMRYEIFEGAGGEERTPVTSGEFKSASSPEGETV